MVSLADAVDGVVAGCYVAEGQRDLAELGRGLLLLMKVQEVLLIRRIEYSEDLPAPLAP